MDVMDSVVSAKPSFLRSLAFSSLLVILFRIEVK